jgi:hypothetical protein
MGALRLSRMGRTSVRIRTKFAVDSLCRARNQLEVRKKCDGVPEASVPHPGVPSHTPQREWRCQAIQKNAASTHYVAQLARFAASPDTREHFMSLHDSWMRLAAEIESSKALLDLIDQIGQESTSYVDAAE